MIYKPSQKESALIFIDKSFEKKKHLKIEVVTESKTLNQIRYIWLVFTIIGHETGNSKEDIYSHYLETFPTHKEININGEVYLIKISMSKFTIEQMSLFIDKVVIDARQEGFIIPDPEDLAAIEAYNYYKKLGLI